MKHIYIILFLIFSLFSCRTILENTDSKLQEYEPIEVQWSAGTDDNNEAVKKSRQFLKDQNIDFLKIYHNNYNHDYTIDSIPYAYHKSGDSLTYFLSFISVSMYDYELIDLLNKNEGLSFYIKDLYANGKFDVSFLDDYSILEKDGLLYYIWTDNKISEKKWSRLYEKHFEYELENDTVRARSIKKKLDESKYLKYDLVFDINKLTKKGNILKTKQRKIELIDTYSIDGKKYYYLTSTTKKYNDTDIFNNYIID